MHRRPYNVAIDDDGRHHPRFERHPVPPLWRQLALGQKILHTVEDKEVAFDTTKAHASKYYAGRASGVFTENDLISWQRDASTIGEVDESSGRAVADDGEGGRVGRVIGFALEARAWVNGCDW